jgi:hypothetical protein
MKKRLLSLIVGIVLALSASVSASQTYALTDHVIGFDSETGIVSLTLTFIGFDSETGIVSLTQALARSTDDGAFDVVWVHERIELGGIPVSEGIPCNIRHFYFDCFSTVFQHNRIESGRNNLNTYVERAASEGFKEILTRTGHSLLRSQRLSLIREQLAVVGFFASRVDWSYERLFQPLRSYERLFQPLTTGGERSDRPYERLVLLPAVGGERLDRSLSIARTKTQQREVNHVPV